MLIKNLEIIDTLSIKCRIESYHYRNQQLSKFNESNDLHIKSLNFKLKGDMEASDQYKTLALSKKDEAKSIGLEAEYLMAKASKLSKSYNTILDMLENNWKEYIDLKSEDNRT